MGEGTEEMTKGKDQSHLSQERAHSRPEEELPPSPPLLLPTLNLPLLLFLALQLVPGSQGALRSYSLVTSWPESPARLWETHFHAVGTQC